MTPQMISTYHLGCLYFIKQNFLYVCQSPDNYCRWNKCCCIDENVVLYASELIWKTSVLNNFQIYGILIKTMHKKDSANGTD